MILCKTSYERIWSVARVLSMVPPEAVEVLVERDPQYDAVKVMVKCTGALSVALAVANAIVSYRLSVRGEEYWQEYARFIQRAAAAQITSDANPADIVSEFLLESRGNRVQREQKAKRLEKARSLLKRLAANPSEYTDLKRLRDELALSLGSDKASKTVVFAVKMAFYAFRALGMDVRNLGEIDVPIDRRMSILTRSSGMLRVSPELIMSRCRDAAVQAWRRVSAASGIPPLKLDTLLWLPMAGVRAISTRAELEEARKLFAERLVNLSEGLVTRKAAEAVAREILWEEVGS
ncbi:MAG: N-glycosylase/DNA lyase [Thermoproteota archaeon]